MNILVINPGSTSTKVAVYANEKPIFVSDITHTREELLARIAQIVADYVG